MNREERRDMTAKDVVAPIQKKNVPAILKAARYEDLESFKAIYESEAISEEMMAKSVIIACRLGHLNVVKYVIKDLRKTIKKCYLDTAEKYKQYDVCDWLEHEIYIRKLFRLPEEEFYAEMDRLSEEEFYAESYERQHYDKCIQKALKREFGESCEEWKSSEI